MTATTTHDTPASMTHADAPTEKQTKTTRKHPCTPLLSHLLARTTTASQQKPKEGVEGGETKDADDGIRACVRGYRDSPDGSSATTPTTETWSESTESKWRCTASDRVEATMDGQ